ncbi:nucleotide-diphospho-sugar transferase [Ostreococcus tauri]|uniref:Nucleotide-diphospho-sugar transferase n=1 Tax=Ostreococcus tauri TaxID=70448 RepID=A0A1Y5HWK0_OSTTA|nr:nucleotide-diphospho-sugar transferase [Ostreococcus tauri]
MPLKIGTDENPADLLTKSDPGGPEVRARHVSRISGTSKEPFQSWIRRQLADFQGSSVSRHGHVSKSDFERMCGLGNYKTVQTNKNPNSKDIARILAGVNLSTCKQKVFHDYEHIVPASKTRRRAMRETSEHQMRPRVLGIITARGGSKGIPGKNIIDLGGKPLIQYTVEAATAAKLLDRCIVSTDCEKIAHIAAEVGCEVPFMRPAEFAQDDSPHMDCIRHAINTLAEQESYLQNSKKFSKICQNFRVLAISFSALGAIYGHFPDE